MKTYDIYEAGSTKIGTMKATCITKAAWEFISTLERPAKYELDSKEQASVRYRDNYTIMGYFVIMQR